MELDKANGSNKWQTARDTEMNQLDKCKTFIDKGSFEKQKIPPGCKKITAHPVFDVEHDGRHEAGMAAGGHPTDTPLDSVHAGVVSLRGLWMCTLLAKLNGLIPHATDIGNACLEAVAREKVCVKAGPEFKEREGHLPIIHKALHGLKSSGKEFRELPADCPKELGFAPSKAEPEIFMRRNGEIWECAATHVDDLCFAVKQPKQFLDLLKARPCKFRLKGLGPLSFHLGCGLRCNKDGHLVMDPVKHIDKMMAAHIQLFNAMPSWNGCPSPADKDCHPESDTSKLPDDEGMQQSEHDRIATMAHIHREMGRHDLSHVNVEPWSTAEKGALGSGQMPLRECA